MVKYINDVVKPEVPYTSSTEFKEEDFEGDVKRVVQLRKRFAKSATSKFSKFLEMSCADGRYRGAHIYHGAGTGRFSGYGAQVQNMPRPVNKLPEIIKARQYLLDPWGHDRPAAMETLLSDCIRGVLIPSDGKVMTAIDFAGIELRVLAWLAGAQTKLNMIRSGRDLYRQMASEIYSKPYEEILKESFERQVGKTGELALGFQGGKGALAKGLKLSGISMTEDEMKKVIKAYREALYNTEIVKFWDSLQKAAIKAVRNPMTSCKAGDHLTFVKVANWLICQLPSKDAQGKRRCIYYPFPEIKYQSWYEKYDPETEETTCRSFFEDPGYPWELKSKGEVVTFRCLLRKGIVTNAAYGGFLAENATQAVARDCMTETMKKITKMKTNVEEIAYEW
jgi:DNA polymerase